MGKKAIKQWRAERQATYVSALAIREILANAQKTVGKQGWQVHDLESSIVELATDHDRTNASIEKEARKLEAFANAVERAFLELAKHSRVWRDEWESWIAGRIGEVLFEEGIPELPFEAVSVDPRAEQTAQAILSELRNARRAYGSHDWDDEERSPEFVEILFEDDEEWVHS